MAQAPITVAIPTYRRESVLLDTLRGLLALQPSPSEILVLDQSEAHEVATEEELRGLCEKGQVRWFRLPHPSITAAMNEGLRCASNSIVLFVDDDVRPEPELLAAHIRVHIEAPGGLVAGRVIQPWQEAQLPDEENGFTFASQRPALVNEFIGCNFSVDREVALAIGGFDENFVKVAYRYEAEFAHRLRRAGRQIRFEPTACLHHLKVGGGGTRSFGEHLTTWRPDHAVGAYYFALRTCRPLQLVLRPFQAVATRYHLRRPWRIPATMAAELQAMVWAVVLLLRGPRLIRSTRKQP